MCLLCTVHAQQVYIRVVQCTYMYLFYGGSVCYWCAANVHTLGILILMMTIWLCRSSCAGVWCAPCAAMQTKPNNTQSGMTTLCQLKLSVAVLHSSFPLTGQFGGFLPPPIHCLLVFCAVAEQAWCHIVICCLWQSHVDNTWLCSGVWHLINVQCHGPWLSWVAKF